MELKLDDLIRPCNVCEGSGGRAPAPKEQEGHGFGQSPVEFPNSRLNVCGACHGRKWELTDSGNVLKEFLQKLKDHQL